MPFLLCPRMQRQPTVKFFAANMAVPHNDLDLLQPYFYTVQSRKLNALLDTVVAESKTVRDPQACIDYLELTAILTEMLGESRHYATLNSEELSTLEAKIQFFLAKVDTVKGTIADWDQKSRRMRMMSRKRARRSIDLQAEAAAMIKRRREEDLDADRMDYNAGYNAPFPQAWPTMDMDLSNASPLRWSQPLCH